MITKSHSHVSGKYVLTVLVVSGVSSSMASAFAPPPNRATRLDDESPLLPRLKLLEALCNWISNATTGLSSAASLSESASVVVLEELYVIVGAPTKQTKNNHLDDLPLEFDNFFSRLVVYCNKILITFIHYYVIVLLELYDATNATHIRNFYDRLTPLRFYYHFIFCHLVYTILVFRQRGYFYFKLGKRVYWQP